MANKWFQFVMDNKRLWTNGMTKNRLEKVKEFVFADKDIMWDLLTRHGANELEPAQMEKENPHTYEHSWHGSYELHHKCMLNPIIQQICILSLDSCNEFTVYEKKLD